MNGAIDEGFERADGLVAREQAAPGAKNVSEDFSNTIVATSESAIQSMSAAVAQTTMATSESAAAVGVASPPSHWDQIVDKLKAIYENNAPFKADLQNESNRTAFDTFFTNLKAAGATKGDDDLAKHFFVHSSAVQN